MSDQEKKVVESLAKAFDLLPDNKKERLIGYAEGVADMAAKQAAQNEEKEVV